MSLLNRIFHILGVDDVPDPAWKATGYIQTYQGHDELIAMTATKRRDDVAEARRKLEAVRSHPPKA